MNFNTNQNRQFYVAKEVVKPKSDKDAFYGLSNHGAYLLLKGLDDKVYRTDLITDVEYVNISTSNEYAVRKTVATATLDGVFTVGTPVLLEVSVPNYIGGGDEYTRSTVISIMPASASALKTDSAEIKKQLAKAFPEYDVDITIEVSSIIVTINYKASNWRLGVSPMRFATVNIAGEHVTKVSVAEGAAIDKTGNMALAELEYFCKGERGDQYRMMGYPNVIPSKYDININTAKYTVFDIHCAYVGPNEMVQKSEKDITIVLDSTAETHIANLKAALEAIAPGAVVETAE